MPDHSAKPISPSFSNPVGQSPYVRYAVAVAAVLIAWAARFALTPLWGLTELPFIFFYPAIVFAAWFGRRGPGLLALGLSVLLADWFFINPVHSFTVDTFRDVAALGAFIGACLFIVLAMEAMHRARARALAELTERERVEAELAHVRKMFATTLGSVGDISGPINVSRQAFVKADPRREKNARRLIGPMFLAAASLLVVSTIFVYQVGLIRIHAQEKMSSQLLVLQQLEDFLSSLKDAETGQRGYLLTGDASYLQPYNEVSAQVRVKLQDLQQLAQSGDLPKEDIQRVAALTGQKLSELERTISLRRDKGLDAALATVRDNQGKQVMDDMRAEIGKLRTEEEQGFASSGSRAAWAANLRTMTFIGACLLNLVFLGWAYRKISTEVLHRETASRETAQQKELLATTLGSIGDAVIVADEKAVVVSLNAEAERLTGWSNHDASGKVLSEIFTILNEQTHEPADSPVDRVLRSGTVSGLANHTVLVAKDGREIPIDDSAAPIKQSGGQLLGVVLVFRDVTEQRQSQIESARLASIVEFSGDAIITKSLSGVIKTWNESAQKLFGYAAEEIVGQPVTKLFPSDRLSEEDEINHRLLQGESSVLVETVRVAKDGRRIPAYVSISPLKDAYGNIIGASTIIHDVSDLVAARNDLLREREQLATTLASIGDAVVITDAEGRVSFVNAEAERLTGWSSAEADGRPLSQVFSIINEQTRQPAENPVDKVLRLGGVVGLANHTVLIAKDGREIPIDDSAAPIRQEGGPLFGIVLVFRDFSDRKRTEQEREELLKREHELRQIAEEANRLKDEFLAIMSHELRNPLNVILGYSELLVRNDEINQLPPQHRMAEAIRRNAKAQSKLICDLLDLSRLRSGKLELKRETLAMVVSANNAIDTVRSDAEAKNIKIEFEQPDESLFVEGDPVRIEQIVWNLLNNSVKFSSAGGRIAVRLGKDGEQVSLTVDDSGQGIDPSFLPHVFELFRQADASTRRSQSGMGIGLAVVQQLVDLHGGSISAYSAGLGKGATFTVKLPLSLEIKPELAPVLDLSRTLDKFSVLVVDDSEDTAEMLAAVLKVSGANVTSATSGNEALLIIAEKEFDIVLSDISMPGMDGFEFLRNLRQLPSGAEVPVLALTGFGRPEDIERAKNEGFFAHVTKPFDIDALMEVLRRIPQKKNRPSG